MFEGSKARNAVVSLVTARVIYATNWLNIGAIFVLMESTLGVGVFGLGTLTSSFYVGLGLMQIPAGVFAAKLGPKKVVVAGSVMYSAATLGISASNLLIQVVLLRVLVGAGMALVFAPSVVLVAKYFGGGRLGIGVGVYNSAYDVGGLLGLYLWIIIASAAGWQSSLLLSGSVGMATCALVSYYVPDDSISLEFGVKFPALAKILKDRQLILLGLGALGLSIGNVLISSFMVYYLNRALGVSLQSARLVAAMIVVVPIATAIWGGRLYDRMKRPRLLMLLSDLGMVAALLFTSEPSLLTPVVCTVLGGMTSGIGFTIAFAWARDLNTAEEEYDGLAVAWVNCISLTGAFLPPLVFSYVVGASGYPTGWLAGAVLCLVLTVPLLFQREGVPARVA